MIDGRPQWREVAILCGYGLGTCVTTATTVALAIAALTIIDQWWFQYLVIGLVVTVTVSSRLTLYRLTLAKVGAAARLPDQRWPVNAMVASIATALAAIMLTAAGATAIGVGLLVAALAPPWQAVRRTRAYGWCDTAAAGPNLTVTWAGSGYATRMPRLAAPGGHWPSGRPPTTGREWCANRGSRRLTSPPASQTRRPPRNARPAVGGRHAFQAHPPRGDGGAQAHRQVRSSPCDETAAGCAAISQVRG